MHSAVMPMLARPHQTVYPALAWWSGQIGAAHPEGCLKQFAAHTAEHRWVCAMSQADEKIY